MKIKSLVSDRQNLIPVDVEISLLPGLPQIQFLGLPDQIIRESVHRIKAALKYQNFDLPRAQQILVNIRPNYLKKTSRGLELAVAAGILWMTEQVKAPTDLSQIVVYGELGLEGEVLEPDDLSVQFDDTTVQVLTGATQAQPSTLRRLLVKNLKDLSHPELREPATNILPIERPQALLDWKFTEAQARILQVAALGEHPLMLAGPAGSGKTSMAKALHALMAAPTAADMKMIKKINGSIENWRPLVQPHHSSTPLALVGGGVPPSPGEYTRAHLGLLILDEFLEFSPRAQEMIREPMEEARIRVSRGPQAKVFPAQAQIVACTNLCPCGDWVPKSGVRCNRSLKMCKDYLNKLSGPVMDRFQLMYFTERKIKHGQISGRQILEQVEKARVFRQGRAWSNARAPREWILQKMPPLLVNELMPREFSSMRRELAALRVALTLADLDASSEIKTAHLEEALNYSWRSFEQLKAWE